MNNERQWRRFQITLPKEYIVYPLSHHYNQTISPINIWVNYSVPFGKILQLETLEIPACVIEFLHLGKAFTQYITDAAFNNYESEKLKEEKPNFDQRLKNFVDAIDVNDDLKGIL